jgi:hypothetical protein
MRAPARPAHVQPDHSWPRHHRAAAGGVGRSGCVHTSPVRVTFDPKAPRTGARRACRGLASRQEWSALPSLQPTVGPGPHFPHVLLHHGVRLERGEAAEALQARREHGAAR